MNFQQVVFESSYGNASQLPASDLAEIVFAGRSNVGKSSMINKIFCRKQLARVSSVPGKTRTINFFRGENLRFADLPGYGYAKVSKAEKERWGRLMAEYFASGRNIALVFSLIDMRHSPTRDDVQMIQFLIEQEFPLVVVLTKKDKLSRREAQERLAAFQTEIPCGDQITMIPFSAETGEGVEEIHAILEEISDGIRQEEAVIPPGDDENRGN